MEKELRLTFAVGFLAVLVVLGTIVYHNVENWNYLDSLYFSTTTIATVGFGDLYPKTDTGKIFTIFYVIIGVATALYSFTVIAEHYFEKSFERNKKIMRGTVNTLRNVGGRIIRTKRNHKEELIRKK